MDALHDSVDALKQVRCRRQKALHTDCSPGSLARAQVTATALAKRQVEVLLSTLVRASERLLLLEELPPDQVAVELLNNLLSALEACAGRHNLQTRQLALLFAANRLVAVLAASGVKTEVMEQLTFAVGGVRKRLACPRAPARPVTCMSLMGVGHSVSILRPLG